MEFLSQLAHDLLLVCSIVLAQALVGFRCYIIDATSPSRAWVGFLVASTAAVCAAAFLWLEDVLGGVWAFNAGFAAAWILQEAAGALVAAVRRGRATRECATAADTSERDRTAA